jgi:hypothetical protein
MWPSVGEAGILKLSIISFVLLIVLCISPLAPEILSPALLVVVLLALLLDGHVGISLYSLFSFYSFYFF